MANEEHPCIIALCRCGCGGTIYANVAETVDKKAQRELGAMVAEGYDIIRTTVGDARTRKWGCQNKVEAP